MAESTSLTIDNQPPEKKKLCANEVTIEAMHLFDTLWTGRCSVRIALSLLLFTTPVRNFVGWQQTAV